MATFKMIFTCNGCGLGYWCLTGGMPNRGPEERRGPPRKEPGRHPPSYTGSGHTIYPRIHANTRTLHICTPTSGFDRINSPGGGRFLA